MTILDGNEAAKREQLYLATRQKNKPKTSKEEHKHFLTRMCELLRPVISYKLQQFSKTANKASLQVLEVFLILTLAFLICKSMLSTSLHHSISQQL